MKLLISFLLLITTLYSKTIEVAISSALTGPAKELGVNMTLGIELYFKKNNLNNKNHNFELIVFDDGYEPKRASLNMRQIVKTKNILAVLGNVGTPTANVTVPIANENEILLFGAFTGAGVLRKNPPDKYIINYRASYIQETESMINGLLKNGIKPEEIALFTQNDGYGDAGFLGVKKALAKNGFLEIDKIFHGRYTRNTLNVEEGLATILDSSEDIKAIIIVGAYAPASKFIKLAKEDFPNAYFLNLSFVGSDALKNDLKNSTKNVIVTQVVPPLDSVLPIVKEYLKDLKKFHPLKEPNFVSLEGYLVGKLFASAVNKIKKENITRADIHKAIENMKNIDIGLGFNSGFSALQHQYSNKIWPTIIKNGKYELIKWNELK